MMSFNKKQKVQHSTHSDFLHKLPVELRLEIYEYVLAFDTPIRLRADHKHDLTWDGTRVCGKTVDTRLLLVNKQILDEAHAILYLVNTVSVSRATLCKYLPRQRTYFAPTLLKDVLISDLYIPCSNRNSPTPTHDPHTNMCAACNLPVFALLEHFLALPRVRHVTLVYGADQRLPHDTLSSAIRTSDRDLLTTQHSLFSFGLLGLAPSKRKTITFRDGTFDPCWRLASAASTGEDFASTSSKSSEVARKSRTTEIARLKKHIRTERQKRLLKQCCSVWELHDLALDFPQALAELWPQDLPMDMRLLADGGVVARREVVVKESDTVLRAFLQHAVKRGSRFAGPYTTRRLEVVK